MPDTARPIHRHPSDLSQDSIKALVSMSHSLTTRHQWFTHVRLPGPHLPHHVRLFHDAHYHGSFTAAARGGLTPAPACRCRRTYLHLHNSTTTGKLRPLHRNPPNHLQDTPMRWPSLSSRHCRTSAFTAPSIRPVRTRA